MSPRPPTGFTTWSLPDQLTWLADQIPDSRNGRVIIGMLEEAAGEIRMTTEQWRRAADAFTTQRLLRPKLAKAPRRKAKSATGRVAKQVSARKD